MIPIEHNLQSSMQDFAKPMGGNAELSSELLKSARIGQAPEKHHHACISSILIATVTFEIFAVKIHGSHEAMKVGQSEPEPIEEQIFISNPKRVMGTICIEPFGRIKIAWPETIQIVFECHHCECSHNKSNNRVCIIASS